MSQPAQIAPTPTRPSFPPVCHTRHRRRCRSRDDTAIAGDIELVAEEVQFNPDVLSASGGSVGVFVDNRDPIRHTFAIEDLDIEVELPANTARRVIIVAPAGTYDYMCTVPGHERMKGTLTIGG